jgi:hypothetical protein
MPTYMIFIEKKVKTYDNCFPEFFHVLRVSCYQGDCKMCSGIDYILTNNEQRFEDNNIDSITYIW